MPEQAMQGRSNPAFHFCDAMEFPKGFWDWEPDEQEAWVEALITDVCKQQWGKRRMNVLDFLRKAVQSAQMAGHIWPEYAACEAALESAWGTSHLATECNNLFGQKSGHTSTEYPQKSMPTHEWQNGKLVPAQANWPEFPDWETSFRERMNVLREARATDESLIYAEALAATSGEFFVLAVSKHWATDPMRGEKVLEIYKAHQAILTGEKA